jgi:hypothetical protein
MKYLIILAIVLGLAGCGVNQVDLDSWKGMPASHLDRHPVFLSVPVVRTVTPDGTEIRNYVNSRNIASCSGGGTIFAGNVNYATYNQFTSCMGGVAACNNIFFIKDGIVEQYTPIGTGGARCYTDDRVRPGFNKPTNIY